MIYSFFHVFFRIFFRVLGRWDVTGVENVPTTGPVIIAANHLSMADPPLVGCSLPRKAWFMAKEELFHPAVGWFLRAMRAFPVKRGEPDMQALKKSLKLLASGEILMIFPEGTRQPSGHLGEPELGVGMIALRSKAPVIPVRLSGTDRLLPPGKPFPRPARVTIRYGKPIEFSVDPARPARENYTAAAREIMAAIGRLPG